MIGIRGSQSARAIVLAFWLYKVGIVVDSKELTNKSLNDIINIIFFLL